MNRSPVRARRIRHVSAAGLGAAAVLGAFSPHAAAASAAPGNQAVRHDVATTSRQDAATRAYWTPERMRNLHDDDPAAPGTPAPPAKDPTGEEYHGRGAVRSTVGRLFFISTDAEDGTRHDGSCTATVVAGANNSTLVTAAHCVRGSAGGFTTGWADKVLFVPGYRDGTAPHGAVTIASVFVSKAWIDTDGEDTEATEREDRAFLVANRTTDGRPVAGAVGAQRISFAPRRSRTVHQFGYPRSYAGKANAQKGYPAFLGERLADCNGTVMPFTPESELLGLPCAMGGGSSGGPNMTEFDTATGTGTVVGVNTLGVVDQNGGGVDLYATPLDNTTTKLLFADAQHLRPPV